MQKFFNNTIVLTISSVYLLYVLFYLYLLSTGELGETHLSDIFANSYFLVALFGGLSGYYSSSIWGSYKSKVGQTLLYFSLGLIFQALGQIVNVFYYISTGEYPYPSLSEVFFIGSIPLYIMGVYSLYKYLIENDMSRNIKEKIISTIIFFTLMIFAIWYFYIKHDFSDNNPLIIFLEIIYPMGEGIYVAFALFVLLGLKKFSQGKMAISVLIITVGLLAQYFADTFYLWLPTTYTDILYLTSYYIMGVSLASFTNTNFLVKPKNYVE